MLHKCAKFMTFLCKIGMASDMDDSGAYVGAK